MTYMPKAGDIVCLTKAASVQFLNPIVMRVIDYNTYGSTPDGWIWLIGYQLDQHTGRAVVRRELFVQVAGLRYLPGQARGINTAKRIAYAASRAPEPPRVPRTRKATR